MTLKQLKAFLVLSRTLNYAHASQELCLSQSALSLCIKTLEEELGGRLFKRNTRKVEITNEGESLLPYAKKLLTHWDEMEKDVKQRFQLNKGTLKIASTSFATHAILPTAVQTFSRLHPNINFSIYDMSHEKIIENVQAGTFEIGLCFEPLNTEQLIFHKLFDENFVAIIPKQHPKADAPAITWSELCAFPFISLHNPSRIRHAIETHCMQHNIVLDLKIECHHISSLSHFVAYGLGVTAIPRHLQKMIDLQNSVVVEISDCPITLPVGMVYRRHFELSHLSSAFIETLLQQHF